MDGIVPAVQQNGGVPGSLNPGMDLYYDVGVPDYYYYFYYDDQDGSDIVSPIDVVSGGAGGVRPLNVIGGSNKNPINTSGKVTGIGNPSGDSSSQEVPPSSVEMKGNNFAGESSRALSPSPDDIKVEDDLTKLHI